MAFVKTKPGSRVAQDRVSARVTKGLGNSRAALQILIGAKAQRTAGIDEGDKLDIFIDDTTAKVRIVSAKAGEHQFSKKRSLYVTVDPELLPVLDDIQRCKSTPADNLVVKDGQLEFDLPEAIFGDGDES